MRKQFFDMPFGTLLSARSISTVMFLAICSMVLAPRFPVEAQQPKKVFRIGYIGDVHLPLTRMSSQFGWLCASLAISKDKTSSLSTDIRTGSPIGTLSFWPIWCVSRLI
jgi:hypothetical protein